MKEKYIRKLEKKYTKIWQLNNNKIHTNKYTCRQLFSDDREGKDDVSMISFFDPADFKSKARTESN